MASSVSSPTTSALSLSSSASLFSLFSLSIAAGPEGLLCLMGTRPKNRVVIFLLSSDDFTVSLERGDYEEDEVGNDEEDRCDEDDVDPEVWVVCSR